MLDARPVRRNELPDAPPLAVRVLAVVESVLGIARYAVELHPGAHSPSPSDINAVIAAVMQAQSVTAVFADLPDDYQDAGARTIDALAAVLTQLQSIST